MSKVDANLLISGAKIRCSKEQEESFGGKRDCGCILSLLLIAIRAMSNGTKSCNHHACQISWTVNTFNICTKCSLRTVVVEFGQRGGCRSIHDVL